MVSSVDYLRKYNDATKIRFLIDVGIILFIYVMSL